MPVGGGGGARLADFQRLHRRAFIDQQRILLYRQSLEKQGGPCTIAAGMTNGGSGSDGGGWEGGWDLRPIVCYTS